MYVGQAVHVEDQEIHDSSKRGPNSRLTLLGVDTSCKTLHLCTLSKGLPLVDKLFQQALRLLSNLVEQPFLRYHVKGACIQNIFMFSLNRISFILT